MRSPPLTVVLLAAAVLLSRLPLLGGGFGSDNDAWRNAVASLHMRELGRYVPSRIPGFPVFELLVAAIVPLGSWATNAAGAIAGTAAVLSFHGIARRLELRHPILPTVAFAFGPPLWVTATQTMDYAFGLAFLLASYDAALARHAGRSGLLLGLAAGCRLTLGLLAVPMLVLVALRSGRRRGMVFSVAFVATAAAVLIPVVWAAPPAELTRNLGYHVARAHVTAGSLLSLTRAAAAYVLGKPGTLILALGLVAAWVGTRTRRHGRRRPYSRAAIGFELAAAAIVLGTCLLIPYDLGYLLPAVPFALLLVTRTLSPAWMTALAVAIVSASLVTPLLDVRRVVPGPIYVERATRTRDLAATRALLAERHPEPTVREVGRFAVHRALVLDPSLERTAAAWAPFLDPPGVALWSGDRRRGFAAFLEPAQRDSLRSAGYLVITDPGFLH